MALTDFLRCTNRANILPHTALTGELWEPSESGRQAAKIRHYFVLLGIKDV